MQEEVKRVDCEVKENDWLDINYVKQFFVKEQAAQKPVEKEEPPKTVRAKHKLGKKNTAILAISCAIVLCFALVLGLGGITPTEWLSNAKETYTYGVSGLAGVYCYDLSATQTVASVEEGNIVFTGGQLALSVAGGKVVSITDTSITVQASEKVSFVYENLSAIDVAAEQEVNKYDILGEYTDMTTVYVLYDGEKVGTVTLDGRSLTWEY
ncbi:MAG: hypothetical protein PHX51_06205 [Clostridia bacterium]|nr:hypothetical protein [Clostridia bacterium]